MDDRIFDSLHLRGHRILYARFGRYITRLREHNQPFRSHHILLAFCVVIFQKSPCRAVFALENCGTSPWSYRIGSIIIPSNMVQRQAGEHSWDSQGDRCKEFTGHFCCHTCCTRCIARIDLCINLVDVDRSVFGQIRQDEDGVVYYHSAVLLIQLPHQLKSRVFTLPHTCK